jgi:hypothetical protein
MRALLVATAIFAAFSAYAEKDKPEDAAEAAKIALGRADEAFNTHDAKAFLTLFDKDLVAWGPTVTAKYEGLPSWKEHIEKMLADGGRITRSATVAKSDADGNTVWYVADYTFVPKVPPGALPVRRPMRESGVLVRRGKDWKFAFVHLSFVQPDPPAKPPTPPPPAK